MTQSFADKRRGYRPDLLPELNHLEECHWKEIDGVFRLKQNRTTKSPPLTVAVVLSGGPAPGGQNVIVGLYDCLKKLNPKSNLLGILGGPEGFLKQKFIKFTDEDIDKIRNQGGFDVIGTGRKKLKTDEDFAGVMAFIQKENVDGLCIIGGDDSNTTGYLIGDYLEKHSCLCHVVGIPKTIDNDVKGSHIECSFGFDTASKTYAELVGNIATDSLSQKKYWFFVKMMGRSASHLTLEVALATNPNIALIGEEIAQRETHLKEVVGGIADVMEERSAKGMHYGICLIPEGIVEFIPDVGQVIQELNTLLAQNKSAEDLSDSSKEVWRLFPKRFQDQMLQERDSHGNVPLAQIATEELLIEMVGAELERRASKVKYNPVPMKYGYDGRCGYPTNFDCSYCYCLGSIGALLIRDRKSQVMASVRNLAGPIETWQACGVPIKSMMAHEQRDGEMRIVMKKSLVDLKGKPFTKWVKLRDKCAIENCYKSPGPIQFDDESHNLHITNTLELEAKK